SRVIRQLLAESVLLAALGGGAGLLLAWWSLKAFLVSALPLSPTTISVIKFLLAPNWRILSFTLLLSLASAIAFGLVPALHATRADLVSTIKDGGIAFSQRMARSRLRRGLVVTHVALCLVLLIAAGLMLRGLVRVRGINPGFETKHVLRLRDRLAQAGYDQSQMRQFREDLVARLEALPGVQSVTRASGTPLELDSRM